MDPLTGTVAGLWRWPVLGLEPERLRAARLGPAGMAGEGVHAVLVDGEPAAPGALPGWVGEYPFNVDSGIDPEHPPHALVVSPDRARRWRWGDPRLERALAAALGRAVELRRDPAHRTPIVVSAQEDAPAHIRLSLDAPAERLAGRQLAFARGVRLDLSGPAGLRGGVEARVLAAGRVEVGETFSLV
jgi:hypothetical protein